MYPITSPGFSSSSTLVSEGDRPATPPRDDTPKSALISQPSTSAPEPSLYLLPATIYGGVPTQHPVALSSGSRHARKGSNLSLFPPRISYNPEERPISFTFTAESPFDTRSRTGSTSSSNHNLLDEIDDAIDQVFLYTIPSHPSAGNKVQVIANDTLPATKYERRDTLTAIEYEFTRKNTLPATKYSGADVLPATKYEPDAAKTTLPATKYEGDLANITLSATKYEPQLLLPATTYEPEPKKATALPSTTYQPERARKDSAVPWLEKELPPVPIDG
jgi:hypothetical protein